MEKSQKFINQNHSKFNPPHKLIVFFVLFTGCLIYIFVKFLHSSISVSSHDQLQTIFQDISTAVTNKNSVISNEPLKQNSSSTAPFDIRMLYPTKENGRVWHSNWSNRSAITLRSGNSDPVDSEFFARGNGIVLIDGNGVSHLQGDTPRMYVIDPTKVNKWNNVEITVYTKRISELAALSSQGIVIGARSEHQDATLENPCMGRTYYGRLLYDGRAVFQKELIHEGSYSVNKPTENNKAIWNTPDGSMPKNVWIGVKFIVKTNLDGKSVKLELYRDLTDGVNGGAWEKVADYNDNGDWSQTNSGVDVMEKCGYKASSVILNSGTSVFIRNDEIKDSEYKLFSIREIE